MQRGQKQENFEYVYEEEGESFVWALPIACLLHVRYIFIPPSRSEIKKEVSNPRLSCTCKGKRGRSRWNKNMIGGWFGIIVVAVLQQHELN